MNAECETITAVGCIIAEIPCVDQIPIERLSSGQVLQVNAVHGSVEVLQSRIIFPPPLCGAEQGSFAEATLSQRLPGVARKTADDNSRSPARERLLDLVRK